MWKLDKTSRDDRPIAAVSKNNQLLYIKTRNNGYVHRSTILGDGNYLSWETYKRNMKDPRLTKVYQNSKVTYDLKTGKWSVETPDRVCLGYFDPSEGKVYLYDPGVLEGVERLDDDAKELPEGYEWIMRGDTLTWEL